MITFVIECILATMACVINSAVLVTYPFMKKDLRKKVSNIIFVFQSFSDIIGIIAMIIHAIYLKEKVDQNPLSMSHDFWQVIEYFYEWATFANILVLLLLTKDRYTAIKYPIFHHNHFTSRRLVLAFCILVTLSTIPAIVSSTYVMKLYFTKEYTNFVNARKVYFLTIVAITLSIIICVYVALIDSYTVRPDAQVFYRV